MKQIDLSSCLPTFHFSTKFPLTLTYCSFLVTLSAHHQSLWQATKNGKGCDCCISVYICQMLLLTFILCSSLFQEGQFHRDLLASASVTSRLLSLQGVAALAWAACGCNAPGVTPKSVPSAMLLKTSPSYKHPRVFSLLFLQTHLSHLCPLLLNYTGIQSVIFIHYRVCCN